MLKRSLATIALAVSVGTVFAGCSSGSSTMSSSASTTTTVAHAETATASDVIAETTRMVCADEGAKDIGNALGVGTTQPLQPTWRNHNYSCVYHYATGSMRLSVQQLPDRQSTERYYDGLVASLGRTGKLDGLGQGAFTTKQSSVVVRKDDKVLVVDVTGLPARFGVPPDVRANVAVTVAATIMGCWTGE